MFYFKNDIDKEKLVNDFKERLLINNISDCNGSEPEFRAIYRDDKPYCVFYKMKGLSNNSVYRNFYSVEEPWYYVGYEFGKNIWDELGPLLESDSEFIKYSQSEDFYWFWATSNRWDAVKREVVKEDIPGSYKIAEESILETIRIACEDGFSEYDIVDFGHDPGWEVDYIVWKVVKANLSLIQKMMKFDGTFPIVTIGQAGSIRVRYTLEDKNDR